MQSTFMIYFHKRTYMIMYKNASIIMKLLLFSNFPGYILSVPAEKNGKSPFIGSLYAEGQKILLFQTLLPSVFFHKFYVNMHSWGR